MYLNSDDQEKNPVHLDRGRESRDLTIPGMVDKFILLTDEMTKVRKSREILRQQIIDKARSYGIKKGELGSICISEATSQVLDTKRIRAKMGAAWIEEFSMPVKTFAKLTIQSRSPEYFAKVLEK